MLDYTITLENLEVSTDLVEYPQIFVLYLHIYNKQSGCGYKFQEFFEKDRYKREEIVTKIEEKIDYFRSQVSAEVFDEVLLRVKAAIV